MKLICEVTEDIHILTESTEDGKKDYFIEGVFLQGDILNRNGRLYPSQTLANEVNRYNEQYIKANRAYGELGHPSGPSINLDRVSHMIKSLKQEGANFIGKAKITDTPMGNIVKSLINEGANLGVSSRGLGSLKANGQGIMEVQTDFKLATAADIVADPSAPDAFVQGVMEGREWVWEASSGDWLAAPVVESIKKELNTLTVKQINENKISMFERFISSLASRH